MTISKQNFHTNHLESSVYFKPFTLLIFLTCLIAQPGALCQRVFGEELETDRDSFTPATTTVEDGRWILEGAYSFIDNRSVPETHSYPELLLRRGVCEWLELRVGWNYEVGGAGSPVSGNVPSDFGGDAEIERESRILYGAKALLLEQSGFRPEMTVLLQGFTPTSGESSDTQMAASYIFGWTTEEEIVWDSAIRYSTSSVEEDRFNVWTPSTVVKVPVGERWKAHAEYFGIFSDGREEETAQHFFSPGSTTSSRPTQRLVSG